MQIEDVKQVKQVIHEELVEEFGRLWEKNLEPALINISQEISSVKNQMVTKSYLDDKLADLEGGLIAKLRKEDEKVNRLVEIMMQKKLLTENEVRQLSELQVFPKPPA